MKLHAGYYPRPRPVDEVVELVGLQEKRDARVKTLSGGQRRRLDLALGIVGDPELLFLDEPTTGFDPAARRRAWELVDGPRDLGTTILLTTHHMDEAEHLADRLVVVHHGRVVAEGTGPARPADLRPGPAPRERHPAARFYAPVMAIYGAAVTAYVNMPEAVARARERGVLQRISGTPLPLPLPLPVLVLVLVLGRVLSSVWIAALTTVGVLALAGVLYDVPVGWLSPLRHATRAMSDAYAVGVTGSGLAAGHLAVILAWLAGGLVVVLLRARGGHLTRR